MEPDQARARGSQSGGEKKASQARKTQAAPRSDRKRRSPRVVSRPRTPWRGAPPGRRHSRRPMSAMAPKTKVRVAGVQAIQKPPTSGWVQEKPAPPPCRRCPSRPSRRGRGSAGGRGSGPREGRAAPVVQLQGILASIRRKGASRFCRPALVYAPSDRREDDDTSNLRHREFYRVPVFVSPYSTI